MKSWEREFEWHGPPCSPSFSMQLRLPHPFPTKHNHTSLASHQKSVIYIVLSNKMSSKVSSVFLFVYIIIIL